MPPRNRPSAASRRSLPAFAASCPASRPAAGWRDPPARGQTRPAPRPSPHRPRTHRFVTDARSAEAGNPQADLDIPGESEWSEIIAARFDHQSNRIAGGDVEQALPDQPAVHRAVEPLIEDRIVDMPVGVIVGPSGGKCRPRLEVRARRPRFPVHHAASYRRRASASSIGHGLFTSNRPCFIASLASAGMSCSPMP